MNRFDTVAKEWDATPRRLIMAKNTISAINKKVKLHQNMKVVDFGTGTGLLLIQVQPYVEEITGLDNSQGMLDVLKEKLTKVEVKNVKTMLFDAETDKMPENKFDLFISGMTFHHVKDTEKLIKQAYNTLKKGGEFCVADLVSEDGSFHADNSGIFHLGFDTNEFSKKMKNAGFKNIECNTAFEIEKDEKLFPIFLAYGKK